MVMLLTLCKWTPLKRLRDGSRVMGVFQFCSMLFAAASSLFAWAELAAAVQRHIFEVTRMDLRAKIIVFALVAPGGESLVMMGAKEQESWL